MHVSMSHADRDRADKMYSRFYDCNTVSTFDHQNGPTRPATQSMKDVSLWR
jgi:hypothetical protein